MKKMPKEEHVFYNPRAGNVNCYHCGEQYQVTPCSLGMAAAVCKQFGKEHRRCALSEKGSALLAVVQKENEGFEMESLGRLSLRPGATLGEKIAFAIEMEELEKLGLVKAEADPREP